MKKIMLFTTVLMVSGLNSYAEEKLDCKNPVRGELTVRDGLKKNRVGFLHPSKEPINEPYLIVEMPKALHKDGCTLGKFCIEYKGDRDFEQFKITSFFCYER